MSRLSPWVAKFDSLIKHFVNQTNKAERSAAEPVEPRTGGGECEPAKHAPGSEPGKRVTGVGAYTASSKSASPSDTQGGSRMPELGTYGSVRGTLSNGRPNRDP